LLRRAIVNQLRKTMIPVYDISTPERERLSWLTCLLNCYRQEHDWNADEDPSATAEMLAQVESLADELEAKAAPAPPIAPSCEADPDMPF
jgi:hypothetical protein